MISTEEVHGVPWDEIQKLIKAKASYWYRAHGEIAPLPDYEAALYSTLGESWAVYDPNHEKKASFKTFLVGRLDWGCVDFRRGILGRYHSTQIWTDLDEKAMEALGPRYEMDDAGASLLRKIKEILCQNDEYGQRAYEWFYLRFYEEWSQGEVAKKYKVSKSRINRLMAATCAYLREQLSDNA